MRIRDLDFFIAVAETGSLRRAAVQADVTQPAITKGINRLEFELGLTLLERSRKGTILSEAGHVFLKRARQLRNDLNDALREASDLRSRSLGLLRIGVAPTLVVPFFSRSGWALLAQRPAARFSLRIALSDQLFAGLRRGELDMVLSSVPDVPDSSFSTCLIGYSTLVVVADAAHPVLSVSRQHLKELVPYQWVLPRRGVLARDWIDGVFERNGLPLPITSIEMDTQTDALLPMIVGSELLSIASESILQGVLAAGLTVVTLDELRWHRRIGALTRADSPASPLVQHFLDILVQSTSHLGTGHYSKSSYT